MPITIQPINNGDMTQKVELGKFTLDLVNQLDLKDSEKDQLVSESKSILSKCISPNVDEGTATGIAIGYVQSGKTMSFTCLTTLAMDNGYRIVIYFAGIKNNLLEQTTKRLKKDLLTESKNSRFYKVFQNPKKQNGVENNFRNALKLNTKPTLLITVLKKAQHINELISIFQTYTGQEIINNNALLIIDDEADQASLNTYARSNSKSEDWEDDEFSSTYASIVKLRSILKNHSYIQYTATPQAPLLISLMDLLSPNFHQILTPGDNYTGGKTFFNAENNLIARIPDEEVYHKTRNPLNDECPNSLIRSLQYFLLGVAIAVNIEEKVKFLSMMVHAAQENQGSKKFLNWINHLIDRWGTDLQNENNTDPTKLELIDEFKTVYDELKTNLEIIHPFNVVMNEVVQVIFDLNIKLVIQGEEEINWSNSTAHILVGADMLNRGFTVEGLSVTYMPRYSVGKSNADTIQQRCRFFGYKNDYLSVCKVYLPNDSIVEYEEYIQHEEILRDYLSKNANNTIENLERIFIISDRLNPTRRNVLSENIIKFKLQGWRQFNALQKIEDNIQFIEKFIEIHLTEFKLFQQYSTSDRTHRYLKINISEGISFLNNFYLGNVPDTFRKSSTIQYLNYLHENLQIEYIYIIEMAYKSEKPRKRSLEPNIDQHFSKIKNIFSGRSTSAKEESYAGDKSIKFEDSLCIQIHKIEIQDEENNRYFNSNWHGKIVYNLGLYYPDDFAHSFVANPEQ
jgi:hypothetical protein